jgi:seryl-tRNA synthetase
MCTGDMGFTQTKKYDLEVWSAGKQKWLEVSSCSNFEAFQSRRMNIKYKSRETGKPEFVHSLNGSGLALPLIVAALIENNQVKVDVATLMNRQTNILLTKLKTVALFTVRLKVITYVQTQVSYRGLKIP